MDYITSYQSKMKKEAAVSDRTTDMNAINLKVKLKFKKS